MGKRNLGLLLVLVLVACSDAGEPPTYVAPPGKSGRLCIEQCGKSRNYCGWSCDLDFRACFADEQAAAQKAYERYADIQFAHHATATLLPSAFEHREKCDAEKKQCHTDCDQPYNACYLSCGGQITPAD